VQATTTAFAPVYRLRNVELSLGAALALFIVLKLCVGERREIFFELVDDSDFVPVL